MTTFQKKVARFGKKRLVIEIPKELVGKINSGDTVIVSKREFPILNKDLDKLYKALKGKFVELTVDEGIATTEGYLIKMDSDTLSLGDKEGDVKQMFYTKRNRIISLEPKIVLKGYYINGKKVTKEQFKKSFARKEFGIAQIVDEDIA